MCRPICTYFEYSNRVFLQGVGIVVVVKRLNCELGRALPEHMLYPGFGQTWKTLPGKRTCVPLLKGNPPLPG